MIGPFVAGVFKDHGLAEHTINALVRGGVPRDGISVVARDDVYERAIGAVTPDQVKIPAREAAAVAGLDRSTEPGIGTLLAAGPLGERLRQNAQSTSGHLHPLIASLTELGMPRSDAQLFADAVGQGAILVYAEPLAAQTEEARRILQGVAPKLCSTEPARRHTVRPTGQMAHPARHGARPAAKT